MELVNIAYCEAKNYVMSLIHKFFWSFKQKQIKLQLLVKERKTPKRETVAHNHNKITH